MVGFIEPVGTVFQSATTLRNSDINTTSNKNPLFSLTIR
jgi:hypothetical protein